MELPTVVVEASRVDARSETMASAICVLEEEAIAHSGARDVPELLEKQANIEVRRYNATQAQIGMRGFGEYSFGRVKVLLDGEELNEVDMSMPDLTRVPIGSVRRVEILPGPSPVLYGDGAVAGVVNILTDRDTYERKTRLTGRVGSYGTAGGNFQTRGGFEEAGLTYSGAYDYEQSDGYRERSAYRVHAFNGALRQHFANGSYVGVKANYGHAFYEMPGALGWGMMSLDRKTSVYWNDWCRVWNYGVGVASKVVVGDEQTVYVDGGYSQKYRRSNWGDYGIANEYDLYSFFLSPRYVNALRVGGHDNTWTLGMDIRYDWYEERGEAGFRRMRYAPYLNEEFFVTDDFSLVAGARCEVIDDMKVRTLGDFELGAVWHPSDDLKVYAKGTRFHRSPFCDEMTYTEDGEALKPETGWSLDVGATWRFLEEFTAGVNGYGMLIDDEIFYDPYAKDYGGYYGGYNCNSPDRTRRWGVDATLGWVREKVAEVKVQYGFVQAQFSEGEYGGCDIPLVPANRVRVEAGVWLCDDLEVKAGYRYISERYLAGDFGNAHGTMSGYSLFDVGAYYEPSWADGWRLAITIDNLLDREYCDYAGWSDYGGAYGYPACGRNVRATLSYEF